MKDAYSFHVDGDDARREYRVMFDTYTRIFERCGLTFHAVEAGTGTIGGSLSHEFQVLAASGEDAIVSCERCGYAANVEKAEVRAAPAAGAGGGGLERVATPGKHSVEEVPSLSHDVDTPDDLGALADVLEERRAVAPMTRGALRQLDRARASRFSAEAVEV